MGGQIQSAIWFKTADADLRPELRRLMIAPSSLFWGVTEGYVCLALLKQIWVIDNPSTICPYPGHFGFVRRAANLHIKREDRNKG